MDFNIHQDHLIIELDEKINSYRNQIEKIKNEINSFKYGNIRNNGNMNYLNNNSSQYNFNYSSNPCLTNKNNCIQNDTLSFNCDQSKVQNLICCYEGQIKSLNEKIRILDNLLCHKQYDDEALRKCIENEIKMKMCNENIDLSEKLIKQKEDFDRILCCKLREKDDEIERMKKDFDREICIREKQIQDIKNEDCNHIKKIENELNNINIEYEKINEKYKNNLKIISDLFSFFHQYISLFNHSGIINCDGEDIKYDENNPNKNLQCSTFIINTLNNFICKLLKDNKEMYELLLNYRNTISKDKEENSQILNENYCLKEQLNNLVNQLSQNSQNQTIKNKETNNISDNFNHSIDFEAPIKKLKEKINDLEQTIQNQNND